MCIWLGLAKIGVVTALINTNLVGDPLVHSITAAKSKAVIFGQDFKKSKLNHFTVELLNNKLKLQQLRRLAVAN